MNKQIISKQKAEALITEQIRKKNAHAGPARLEETRPGEWSLLAQHHIDASTDAEGVLREFLMTHEVSDAPEALPVENMDATNDK